MQIASGRQEPAALGRSAHHEMFKLSRSLHGRVWKCVRGVCPHSVIKHKWLTVITEKRVKASLKAAEGVVSPMLLFLGAISYVLIWSWRRNSFASLSKKYNFAFYLNLLKHIDLQPDFFFTPAATRHISFNALGCTYLFSDDKIFCSPRTLQAFWVHKDNTKMPFVNTIF